MKNKIMILTKKLKVILFCTIIMILVVMIFQNMESKTKMETTTKTTTKTMTAGVYETVSVFDMKTASIKNLTFSSSDKRVSVKKKTYLSNGKKHTAVLACVANNTWKEESSSIIVKYYNANKRKSFNVRIKINFAKEYNRGYSATQLFNKGEKKSFKIDNSVEIDSIHSTFGKYSSSMLGFDTVVYEDSNVCTMKTSEKNKNFTITATNYGYTSGNVFVDFKDGSEYWYQFGIMVPKNDGSIYTESKKVVKGKSVILYFTPPKSGKLSIDIKDNTIVSAKLSEDVKSASASLLLNGLKIGKTDIFLTYHDKGKAIVNKYEINVIETYDMPQVVTLKPKEVKGIYTCSYPITDTSGNPLTGGSMEQITSDSSEVNAVLVDGKMQLSISAEGTYHVNVIFKNIDGSVAQKYTLTIIAENLKYSDEENITFATEAKAKDFFGGTSGKSWWNEEQEYTVEFLKDDVINAIDGTNPWFLIYGDSVDGDATYSIDINRKVIVINDYKQTIELGYRVISKRHIRLTYNGRTLDYFVQ
ncbi:hypothetical protein [Anaeromicropila herbilytica]|uniref:Uncharacterized protein n=1 Tax=Anaeromicropila herbilytica TaxID=2785025 RepID=A0A7R7ELP9_9FIRM|nr:hypothetical protein [Anaeromicropila herbilytica]BCN30931.1 hypothetical protein bsdtb5_22260 [Anaeromicropila herbilytica]